MKAGGKNTMCYSLKSRPEHEEKERDGPPDRGIRLFLRICLMEWKNLILLNLLFILFCLPVLTIGPATAAMAKITLSMVEDHPVDLWYDFRNAFRDSLTQGIPAGFLTGAFIAAISFSAYYYLTHLQQGLWMYFLFAVTLVILFVALLACIYVYPQVAALSLPLKSVFKNSILLALLGLKHSAPALISILAALSVPVVFPAMLPALIFVTFSFISLISSFAAWTDIKKHIITDHCKPGF